MPIVTRTKSVLYYYITCPPGNGGGSECVSHEYYVTEPIRDWVANPVSITPSNWTIGGVVPPPVNLTITFPELSEIEDYKTMYPGGFRFKIKKAFAGVDFVSISGASLTGSIFNGINLNQETVSVSFQNLDNLAIGLNSMDLLIEAYGIDAAGNEIFVEDSSIKNIIIHS